MEELLTPEEVSKYLKIKLSTVFRYASEQVLPAYKMRGRLLRFKKSDIENWLEKQLVR
jgi:excisionase family DNA binding protein